MFDRNKLSFEKTMPNNSPYTRIHFDTIDSTQLYVRRNLDEMSNLTVVTADFQSAGKGQGDHKWQAAAAENLTFSLVIRYGQNGIPRLSASAASQKALSDSVAGGVIDYLEKHHGISAWMKQPNDVYVEKNKICGMLIEHRVNSSGLLCSVLGIGIDINQTVFPEDIPNPVSLKILTGKSYNLDEELPKVLDCIVERLKKL